MEIQQKFKARDYTSAKIAWDLQNDQAVIIFQDLYISSKKDFFLPTKQFFY